MALAILDELGIDGDQVRFRIDTGTNRYYQLRVGRGVGTRDGFDWLEDVYFTTPVSENELGGSLLNSSKEISLPLAKFDRGQAYVQLYSYKDRQGKSPAFSRVVRLFMGVGPRDGGIPDDFSLPFSVGAAMNNGASFNPPRHAACRTYKEAYSQQASLDDLLGSIIQVAAPLVMNLLSGNQPGGQAGGAGGGTAVQDLLPSLLNAIMGMIAGPASSNASGTANSTAAVAAPQASVQQSLVAQSGAGNRFLSGPQNGLARQMDGGIISGPLLASLIGSVVKEALPEVVKLVNQANQNRLQMKATDNKLMTDLLAQMNQRILLQQLLNAQQQQPQGSQPAGMEQLIQLLQSLPPPAPDGTAVTAQPAVTNPPVSTPQSLRRGGRYATALSGQVMVSFLTAPPVVWNGEQKVLFARGQGIQLKVQLNTPEPAPKAPLPKAILKVVFKDGRDQAVCGQKTFKLKDLPANSPVSLDFTAGEIAPLPADRPLNVFAEVRWLSAASGKEYKAVGSTEIVLVERHFVKDMGQAGAEEREPADMNRYRPFWNKVWEAPTLTGATPAEGRKKSLWALDVHAKYTVLLTAEHEANGLMGTRIQRQPPDKDSLTEATEGKLKGGIELSIAELNKLLPLWNAEPLDPQVLRAFNTPDFARKHGFEMVYRLKLKGRAAERGLVWVVPVFSLYDFTLGVVQQTDETGQVTEIAEQTARFPLPSAARIIGLKSGQEDEEEYQDEESEEEEGGEAEYRFAGFEVQFSEKVMLTRLGAEPGIRVAAPVAQPTEPKLQAAAQSYRYARRRVPA